MARDFYGTGRTEISLRDELIRTLQGGLPEISKKQIGLLRIMKRDSARKLIPCICTNKVTGEPDKDGYCPFCLGEGFLWEEQFVDFYRSDPGVEARKALRPRSQVPGEMNVPLRAFYLEFNKELTLDDRVIELVLDGEGKIVHPMSRRAIYHLGDVYDYRADNGRIEFWKAIGWSDLLIPLNPR
jgi:hypothetical protein